MVVLGCQNEVLRNDAARRGAVQREQAELGPRWPQAAQPVRSRTPKSNATITLPRVTISVLYAHRARQQEEKRLAGSGWLETGYVFTTTKGTPIGPRNALRAFYAVLCDTPPRACLSPRGFILVWSWNSCATATSLSLWTFTAT